MVQSVIFVCCHYHINVWILSAFVKNSRDVKHLLITLSIARFEEDYWKADGHVDNMLNCLGGHYSVVKVL